MTRQLDRRYLVQLVLVTTLAGAAFVALHDYQVRWGARAWLRWANQAEQNGQDERVAEYLNRYLGYRPGDRQALARYGLLVKRLARTHQDRLRAFFVLEKALGMGVDRPEIRRALVDLALELSDRDPGRISDAREHLEALRVAKPGDGELEQRLGRCLEALGDNAEAIRHYEDAIQHGPARVETYERLARLLRNRLRRTAEADQVMDRLVAANGQSAEAYLARWNYRRAYHINGAAEDAERALAHAPNEVRAILAVANEARGPSGLKRALDVVRRGLARYPSDARLLANLVDLERAAGKPETSLALLRKSVGGPSKPPAGLRIALVESLADAGRPDEAQRELDRVAVEEVTPGTIEYLRARLLAAYARWTDAVRVLEDARPRLLATPVVAEKGLLLLARCHEQLGETDRAAAAYRRVLEGHANSTPAVLGLAAAHEALGQLDVAAEHYRRISADSPEASLGLVRILILRNRAKPELARDWTEVDRLLDASRRAAPDSAEWPVLRAEALAARGRKEDARAQLQTAVRQLPDELGPRLALARLALRGGDRAACRAALDAAGKRLGDRIEIRLARLEAWDGIDGPEATDALARLAEGLDRFAPDARRWLVLKLIAAYGRRGDAAAADRLARHWGRAFAKDPVVIHARFEAALRARDNAALDRALADLHAAESRTQGVLWRYDRARRLIALARTGDHQGLVEARALIAEAGQRRPGWPELSQAEAEIEELSDHPDKAIIHYRRALERGTSDRQVAVRLVALLHERRRDAEAETYLHPWLSDAPPGDPIRRLAAEVALRTGRQERAVERARAAIANPPQGADELRWLGQILDEAGRPDEAEPFLRQAIKEAPPGSAEPLVALLRHLVRRGRAADAETFLRDTRPSLTGSGASLVLARCEEALSHEEAADTLYDRALNESPQDAMTLHLAAEHRLRGGQTKQAEPLLRALVALGIKAPDDAAWARPILALSVAAGEPEQVRSALQMAGVLDPESASNGGTASDASDDRAARARILAVQPGRSRRREAIKLLEDLGRSRLLPVEDRFLVALLLEREHNWSNACRHLLFLAGADDAGPDVLAHYVRDLLHQGDTVGAHRWLEKLESLTPQAFEPVALRARLLEARGRADDAARRLQAEAEARPDRAEACAALLEEGGRFDMAETILRRTVATSRDEPERALTLAKYLGRRNRAGEALDLCAAARPRCRGWAVADAALAVLDAADATEDQFRRVEAWMEASAREHPEAPSYLFSLSCLRHVEGRYAEAKTLYRRVLRKDPEYGPALNNLAYLLALDGSRTAEAEDLIARAIRTLGPLPQLLDTRAAVYLAMGRHAAAIDDLEEAVEAAPRASRLLHLARAYAQAGDNPRASTAFRRAKDLGLDPRHLHPAERSAYDSLSRGLAQK
jgi:tetratricopeptide (TPR) repeat protein